MSEQDKEMMEAAAEKYEDEHYQRKGCFPYTKDAYVAGWKAASERKDAEIEGIRADRDALDDGNIALNEKLAIAVEALENIRSDSPWQIGAVAGKAFAKIKGEK